MTRKIVIILTMVLVACLYLNTNQLLADNQQAEKFYQKGEEYYNLGIKDRSISRLKKAQKYFSQCAKIDPDYKNVKQHLSSLEEIIKRFSTRKDEETKKKLRRKDEETKKKLRLQKELRLQNDRYRTPDT